MKKVFFLKKKKRKTVIRVYTSYIIENGFMTCAIKRNQIKYSFRNILKYSLPWKIAEFFKSVFFLYTYYFFGRIIKY